MRGAREAFSHSPEDFRQKEAFELKKPAQQEEKQRKPEVKLGLIKTENPQQHAIAVDQAQKRAETLADKNEQSKKEVTAVQFSSVDLKAQLDQVPRWQLWRRAERTVLQNQLDQALKREKDARDAKKERLKAVHTSLEQTIDGPARSLDPKQQRVEALLQQRASTPEGAFRDKVQQNLNEVYTQIANVQQQERLRSPKEMGSSQEKSFPKQEEVTSTQVLQEIDQLKKDLKKVSWWKVTDKALISRRIQAKEFQLNKLQSEPKKRERSPFEQEEQNLRELTDRRNVLSGVERDKASQRVDAAYNRLQELKRGQSNIEGENRGEERKAA